jgi:hypothetical protein
MGFMDINSHWRTKLRRELPLRFFVVLVAGIPVRDSLLRAKHLFSAAILWTSLNPAATRDDQLTIAMTNEAGRTGP